MEDFLESLVRTNLDLHFGRLTPLAPQAGDQAALGGAAAGLARHISEHILKAAANRQADATVQRHIFNKENALPQWLVNKGLVRCNNDMAQLESAVSDILGHAFHRRRFLDYLSGELEFHGWLWSAAHEKRHWPVRRISELCDNGYCISLNTRDFVIKLGDTIMTSGISPDTEEYSWYIRSIGTITLLDFATKPIFEYTGKVLEAKYKTSFIVDIFKKQFAAAYHDKDLARWGLLVMGDIPKIIALDDFHAELLGAESRTPSQDIGVMDLLRLALARFDEQCNRQYPEARFRLGTEPPLALANKIGAVFWLRRTLAAAKAIQQKNAKPSRGHMVEERSFLTAAMDQKSILYFCLVADTVDSEINPCYIKSLKDSSMVLQSPRGNKLNESRPGQNVHGYFCVTGSGPKSTYCDFRTEVLSVTDADDRHCLVEVAIPTTFELTRRTHKRMTPDPSRVLAFELSAPAGHADWSAFGNRDNWPHPLCIIPDAASHCQVKDLSAGGLMLEIHRQAPAFEYFIERNREYPLLALLHLAGKQNMPDLMLGLRLEIKRIRDYRPLKKKYVGLQFIEAGEIRNEKFVRFAEVGKDGIFLINDWIFRNSIAK